MFTSLLVGLDGSLASQVALAQGILVGQRFRARVVLLHVAPVISDGGLGPAWMEWTPGDIPAGGPARERAAREMLEDAAGAVRRAGLEAETIWRQGSVVDVLHELASDVGVVLVGREGIRGETAPFGTDPLGPDTRELIRRCPRPVLVAGTTPSPMDRCLVAYGANPMSDATLEMASRFAGILGGHLDVLHVNDDEAAGRSALARVEGALSVTPISFETHLGSGPLDRAIADTVARLKSNTLFAGAHRQEGEWLVASPTETILRATAIPVLVHTHPPSTSARVSAPYRRPPS